MIKRSFFRNLFFFLGIILSGYQAVSQPDFTANTTKACVGEKITFTDISANGANITYDFGDGRGRIDDSNINYVTYTKGGKYTVIQYGNFTISGQTRGDSLAKVDYIEVLDLVKPSFEVENCENKNVTITITDTRYDEYEVDVEDDGTFDLQFNPGGSITFPYSAEGYKTVRVRPTKPPGCNKIDSAFTFYVFSALKKPDIISLTSSESQVILSFQNLEPYFKYYVEMSANGGATYTPVGIVTDVTQPFVVSNVSPASKAYCFHIVTFDDCGNNIPSDPVCSIVLSGQAQNNLNATQWQSDQSFINYTLYKNNSLILNLSPSTSYSDADVKCSKNYCYRVTGRYGTNGGIVNSNELCLKATSDNIPDPIKNPTASVENGLVSLTWNKPAGMSVKQYRLVKVSNGSSALYSGLDSLYKDNRANTTSSVNCYTLNYTDSCNNATETAAKACTILLSVEVVARDNNKLQWTQYEGWENGVANYYLEKLDEEGNVYEELPMGFLLNYDDLSQNLNYQLVRYRIKAVPVDGGLPPSFSNIIEIKQNFLIFLPNAFSPNGDGNNEIFEPKGSFIKKVRMAIYNKWGELIYEGKDWDGKMKKGGMAPVGVYLYIMEAEDFVGEIMHKKGSVTLIK